MPRSKYMTIVFAQAFVCAMAVTAHAQHAGDIWIGRSAAGQLKIDTTRGFDPLNVIILPATDPPGGWSSNNPGFDKISQSYPDQDIYTLGAGHEVWLELISIDPACYVIVPPSYVILDTPGDRTKLSSGSTLHKHLLWYIDGEDSLYDPGQCLWNMTFVLKDYGTTHYADSRPFVLHLATGPACRADFNCDGHVDAIDFDTFSSCYNGPTNIIPENCRKADLNDDSYVDAIDFDGFSGCYNGPTNPPGC